MQLNISYDCPSSITLFCATVGFFPSNSRHNSKSRYKPSKRSFSCLTATLESDFIVQNICNTKAKFAKNLTYLFC